MLGYPAETFGKPGDIYEAMHSSRYVRRGLVVFTVGGRTGFLPGLTDDLKGCQGRLKVNSPSLAALGHSGTRRIICTEYIESHRAVI